MKKHGLLTVKRKANWNFYEIASNLPKSIYKTLAVIETNHSNDSQLESDLKRLNKKESVTCC